MLWYSNNFDLNSSFAWPRLSAGLRLTKKLLRFGGVSWLLPIPRLFTRWS